MWIFRIFVPFFLIAAPLVGAAWADAAAPTQFEILSPKGAMLTVFLNDILKITIDGDTSVDPEKMVLRIGDDTLGVVPVWLADKRQLDFSLTRTDGAKSNRKMWSSLLGSPFRDQTQVLSVGLIYDGKPLSYAAKPGADSARAPQISMVKFNTGLMVVGVAAALVVLLFTILLSRKTPMLRDAVLIAQIPPLRRPFSLGKCQMAVWFCLILASFLLIFAVLWDMNSLNTESFTLLGISAATAMGAVAIDSSKDRSAILTQIQSDLTAMGLKTSDDVAGLEKAANKTPSPLASTVVTGAVLPNNPNPTAKELWDAYQAKVRTFESQGLLKDLINDADGPTLHRFQIVIWTIVLAAIYVGYIYLNLETPTFGTNLLALLGISGGIYLGFKIPEKQS